ncbi:DUF2125 domain-containing protein [uncultured Roseibium sp.]|uniref:DUF2125 domain-containing protein n=1 Tax=uncultured Roseibium sp. TaxID=1936171 RepID=UPI0026262FFF|nr:DUF2125 domain-containing protein [uncultured Roseibium sp.]
MSSKENLPSKPTKRRYIVLMSVLALVVLGWSAVWFFGRSFLHEQLNSQMSQMAAQGLEVSCADLEINGFPFRYEVSCRQMTSADRSGTAAKLGGLNAVALIYNPTHVIFEAGAPAVMDVPLSGMSGDMTWETARASMKFGSGALGKLDAVVEKPEAVLNNPVSTGSFAAEKAELHVRQSEGDADFFEGFLSVDALQLRSLPALQDALDLRAHLQIPGGASLLAGANLPWLVQSNGGELPVKLVVFDVSLGDSRVKAVGDFVVNGDGTLSGTLDLSLGNAEALIEAIRPLAPAGDRTLALVEQVVKSLDPVASDVDGVKTVPLKVNIDRGIARIGLLPLPPIPPLFQAGF